MTHIALPIIFESMADGSVYTPDLLHLRTLYDRVPVFVYGPEKTGFSDNYALRGSEMIGCGFTVLPTYEVYVKNFAPIALTRPVSTETGPIFGELWMVDIPTVTQLDNRFCNGVQFQRRFQHVKYYSREKKDSKIKEWFVTEAYLWVGINQYWDESCQRDSTTRLLKKQHPHQGQPYYLFSKLDDYKPASPRALL